MAVEIIDLSIIIVSWNTRDILRNCVNSIISKTSNIKYEIIVVDNASNDGSVEMLKREVPKCIIIGNTQNVGFAKANNQGLKIAQGTYMLFINSDTLLITSAINGMINFLRNNSAYGAVGPKLLLRDGRIQNVCARDFPTLRNQLIEILMLNRLIPNTKFFSTIELEYWDHNDCRDIKCLSGAAIMTKRELMVCLGGFSEDYFMYTEDVDLCYRIGLLGKKIHYLANENILHLSGSSSEKRGKQYFASVMIKESNCLFFKKYYGDMTSYLFRAVIFIGSIFRMLVFSIICICKSVYNFKFDDVSIDQIIKYFHIMKWSIYMLSMENYKR